MLLKKDGAALVQRAACQIAHLFALNPSQPYERNKTGGPSAFAALVATTNVGHSSESEESVSAIEPFAMPTLSSIRRLITFSRTVASKRHRSSPVGMLPAMTLSTSKTFSLNSIYFAIHSSKDYTIGQQAR